MADKTKISKLAVAMVVIIVGLLLIIMFMKAAWYKNIDKLSAAREHIELTEAKCNVTRAGAIERIKETIHKDMKNAFNNRLIEIVMDMQPKLDRDIATKIVKHIMEESEAKDLDPVLISALMWTESRFDPFAISNQPGD